MHLRSSLVITTLAVVTLLTGAYTGSVKAQVMQSTSYQI